MNGSFNLHQFLQPLLNLSYFDLLVKEKGNKGPDLSNQIKIIFMVWFVYFLKVVV